MRAFLFGVGLMLCVLKWFGVIQISWFLATLPIFWWFYVFAFAYITSIVVLVLLIVYLALFAAKEKTNERTEYGF
jgi:hypothetical protein